MKNQFVADILYQIADLLDLKGDIFFKTRAYRIAAQTIEALDEDIADVVKDDRLDETGKLEYFENLKKEIPEGLLVMLDILGLGPKKVASLYNNLGIETIEQLRTACIEGKVRNLDGFGEITERNILRGIQLKEKTSGRVLLNLAIEDSNNYIDYLKKCKEIDELSIAGSLRRKKETIGDIDILTSSDSPEKVMDFFVKYYDVQRVLMEGATKSSILLNDGLQVDLRVVKKDSFGSALQYFTGSKEHNVRMRNLAIKKGYKLSEYGLFEKDTEKYIVGKTEEEVYNKLGLEFIAPELRENRGEIQTASEKKLPKLVDYDDIIGDLHVHSLWSDGFETIETMAKHCQKMGYEYVGIADHSQTLMVANGLSEERVIKKIGEIKKLNKKMSNFRIFCGAECDIKADGTLDYSNKTLELFDYVGLGIHTNFKMSLEEVTDRIIKGIENEHVDFLAHPTCRIIGRREPFDLDIKKIFDTAVETDTYLEINAFPDRLDLNDINVKHAKEKGVKFIIGTDAHNVNHLPFMQFGIATARRGWLEKKDILNTYTLKEIEKIFRV